MLLLEEVMRLSETVVLKSDFMIALLAHKPTLTHPDNAPVHVAAAYACELASSHAHMQLPGESHAVQGMCSILVHMSKEGKKHSIFQTPHHALAVTCA